MKEKMDQGSEQEHKKCYSLLPIDGHWSAKLAVSNENYNISPMGP